jgi:sulfite exporter TauE/SafE
MMIGNVGASLFWMLVGHALADYPLQGDWMARAKNPTLEPDIWPGVMTSHCLIHAGAVLLATGSAGLAIAEYVSHFAIDYLKCKGRISYNVDQSAHVFCKLVWWAALLLGVAHGA